MDDASIEILCEFRALLERSFVSLSTKSRSSGLDSSPPAPSTPGAPAIQHSCLVTFFSGTEGQKRGGRLRMIRDEAVSVRTFDSFRDSMQTCYISSSYASLT